MILQCVNRNLSARSTTKGARKKTLQFAVVTVNADELNGNNPKSNRIVPRRPPGERGTRANPELKKTAARRFVSERKKK